MSKYVLGIDIGGTKITGVLFDGRRAVKELTVVTPKNFQDFAYCLKRLVKFLSFGKQLKAVGVGIPGFLDKRGRVAYCPNTHMLLGRNLESFFRGLGFAKVAIANDADCFTLAEARLGQGRRLKNFIGITLGTGIGSGLVLGGKLYSGSRRSAGEVGHTLADAQYDFEHYFQIYRRRKAYKKIGPLLGRLFVNLYNLLDIDAIILGGSVALYRHRDFLPAAAAFTEKRLLNRGIKPKFLISKIKHAGAIGAALLLWED